MKRILLISFIGLALAGCAKDKKTSTNNESSIETDSEKSMPRNLAIERCKFLINSNFKEYGDVDIYSLTGTKFGVSKIDGTAYVSILVDVKNKLDGDIAKVQAKCSFDSGSWNENIIAYPR